MQTIDEPRLESDAQYRYQYLCEFIGFDAEDAALIQAFAPHLGLDPDTEDRCRGLAGGNDHHFGDPDYFAHGEKYAETIDGLRPAVGGIGGRKSSVIVKLNTRWFLLRFYTYRFFSASHIFAFSSHVSVQNAHKVASKVSNLSSVDRRQFFNGKESIILR